MHIFLPLAHSNNLYHYFLDAILLITLNLRLMHANGSLHNIIQQQILDHNLKCDSDVTTIIVIDALGMCIGYLAM